MLIYIIVIFYLYIFLKKWFSSIIENNLRVEKNVFVHNTDDAEVIELDDDLFLTVLCVGQLHIVCDVVVLEENHKHNIVVVVVLYQLVDGVEVECHNSSVSVFTQNALFGASVFICL